MKQRIVQIYLSKPCMKTQQRYPEQWWLQLIYKSLDDRWYVYTHDTQCLNFANVITAEMKEPKEVDKRSMLAMIIFSKESQILHEWKIFSRNPNSGGFYGGYLSEHTLEIGSDNAQSAWSRNFIITEDKTIVVSWTRKYYWPNGNNWNIIYSVLCLYKSGWSPAIWALQIKSKHNEANFRKCK